MIDRRKSKNWTFEDHSDTGGNLELRSRWSSAALAFADWGRVLEAVELLVSVLPEPRPYWVRDALWDAYGYEEGKMKIVMPPFWNQTDYVSMARSLRLAIVKNVSDQGLISAEEAKEVLSGPLVLGDPLTVYDDSEWLDVAGYEEAQEMG